MSVYALNSNGQITICTAPIDKRGIGRCNHIEHQRENETPKEFLERIKNIEVVKRDSEKDAFIPEEGTTVELKQYKISDEDKLWLTTIENRMQLNMDTSKYGAYMELDTPIWNDMDLNTLIDRMGDNGPKGANLKNLKAILHEEATLVVDKEGVAKGKMGDILSEESFKNFEEKVISKDISRYEVYSGVQGLNRYAKEYYGVEATDCVFVLPFHMRLGSVNTNGESIDNDLTIGYKYLLRNKANPQKCQLAYEALLNNNALSNEMARYNDGFRNKSLADQFAGKGGVFRAYLSGNSIPYSARTVISPSIDMKFGECKIPPSVAVDIFRPTLIRSYASDGYTNEQIDSIIEECRKNQSEVDPALCDDISNRIAGKRVALNRQPSLHTPSFQSYRPICAPTATTQIHPLNCKGYNADFDGDEQSIYAFNDEEIIDTVDRTIGTNNAINTHQPREYEKSIIMPTKEALFGLLSILERRTN